VAEGTPRDVECLGAGAGKSDNNTTMSVIDDIIAARKAAEMGESKKHRCRHCGKVFEVEGDARVTYPAPTHDWPPPCRSVCSGSGKGMRRPCDLHPPEKDRAGKAAFPPAVVNEKQEEEYTQWRSRKKH
jgi:hypothetical protein